MKTRNLLLGLFLLFSAVLTAEASTLKMEARQLPALYKVKNGTAQKIQVSIDYSGKSTVAVLKWNGKTRKEKLETGKKQILLDIETLDISKEIEIILSCNGEQSSVKVPVERVRNWEIDFIQHTHTDIGYTRSQMEILAEQLRYIDYALDYCDATDDYPEYAKFRWVCETSWAVSEYLKSRPDEQIARLKKRVEEGRIELGAMYLNFDELPDEQTLAASLYPLNQFREAGLKSEMAMQNDVNGIGWCFSEYFQDLGIKYVTMGTHGHRALICFDKPTVFWWESPSGKKVLTYRAEHYHTGNFFGIHTDNFVQFEQRLLSYLNDLNAKNYPYDILAIQYSGYLTDNSPPATQSSDIEIAANDSIYVFVQVTIDPTSQYLPFIVRDSIQISFNGNEKWVQLEAWGQNAHFLRSYEVTGNETWSNDKPYVILDYLYITPGSSLTLQKGCRLYMHANAPVVVDGTLRTEGQADSLDRVYFQSDRLDEPYRNYPAGWPGIHFRPGSSQNVLNYAVIQHAYQSVVVEGMPGGIEPKLILSNSIINNSYETGLWAVASSVDVINSVISNCGKNLVLEGGGVYNVVHSTIVTYSSNYISHKSPVVSISNHVSGTDNPLIANFINNIIWGEGGLIENEVQVTKSGSTVFDVVFDHNLWKNSSSIANITSYDIINGQAPEFEQIDIGRRFYNFRLLDNSPAIGAGKAAGIATDIDGRPRPANSPDLGAYQSL